MAKSTDKKNKKKNKNIVFIWGLWALVALIIFLMFFVKKDVIVSNLKTTGFFDRVFGSTPQFIEKHPVTEDEQIVLSKPKKKNEAVIEKNIEEKQSVDLKKQLDLQLLSEKNINENKTEVKEELVSNNEVISKTIEEKSEVSEIIPEVVTEKKSVPVEPKKTDLNLCFVLIDGEGHVSRKEIKRTVVKNDSPLTSAIELLLAGPVSGNSGEKDCISLIPEGTRLLGARVQNGIAYLNFSEEFEFNSYGVEGYRHQLEQIVFTATSFSTVKSVQFLIEGNKEQYLGSEGIWIGSPLSRSSF